MKRLLILLLVLVLALSACSNDGNNAVTNNDTESNNTENVTTIDATTVDATSDDAEEMPAGGIAYSDEQVYEGVYSGEITTLNYLVSSSTNELGLAANFVDTLVDYDKFGVLTPSLATEWSTSPDGLVWTFEIREGVNWYTSEGDVYAETTAQDFVDTFKYTLNPDNGSKTVNIAYSVVENAEAFYNGEITDFEQVGVKALDTYTLEFTLKTASPYFESMLTYGAFFPANGTFLAEVGDQFGSSNDTILYNGAYILSKFEPQNKRLLDKNQNYWDADKVYIEEIKYKYNKEASTIGQELFLRGDIAQVSVPSTSIDAWMQDDEKKQMVRPANASSYTYFYSLNFDPRFDDAYDPEVWAIAVNNLNFRKSLFHGLDRIAALTTGEPYNPENKISNTITPANFVNFEGKDFIQMGSLAKFANNDSFDAYLAVEYKEKAMAELEGLVDFPVKMMIPYSTGSSENAQRAQVIQQQLIRTLGDDFIDVYIVPYPSSGFTSNTRRNGNHAIELVNWGPDYADPHTYTEPFATLYGEGTDREGTSRYKYNFPESTTEVDENGVNKFEVYAAMVDEAAAETVDLEKRYTLYAEAEAYVIENAWVIPYREGGGGYVASRLNPFESAFSPFGLASERFKGMHILETPMSSTLYFEEEAKWNTEREEALK